jgi:magnesium transporter
VRIHRLAPSRRRPRRAGASAGVQPVADGPSAARAFLYDADGRDRPLTLDEVDVHALGDRQLLWVDVADLAELERAASTLGITDDTVERLRERSRRPAVVVDAGYAHIAVVAAVRTPFGYEQALLDCVAGDNWVLTVHDPSVDFLDHFESQIAGNSRLGRLDALGLVSVFLHEHVAGYLREIEPFELALDQLDLQVMAGRGDDPAVFHELVELRRRLSVLRRMFAPHRELYGRLARADFEVLSEPDSPEVFASLAEHVEETMDALDTTHELIISSFDVYTTWTAHATNRVIKVLTVASVTLLPPTLIASVMGMNSLPHPLLASVAFVATLTAMLGVAGLVLGTARWRGWI